MSAAKRPETSHGAAVPHVSVVVPTHARPESLSRALRHLIAQDWPADSFDIHVVHNRSADDTEARVAAIAAETPVRIRYSLRDGRGPAPSRQFGAMEAEGSIIAFIDDDCEPAPGWIAAGVAAFGAETGMVQGRNLPNPGHARHLFEKTVNVPGPSPYFETCNIFYRAEAFHAAGGFEGPFADVFFGEDTDLGNRVLAAGWAYAFAPEALVHHDVTRQSVMRWLMECWHLRNIPMLVRLWPSMRRELFLGVFLSRQSAAFDLGLLGLLAAPFTSWLTLLLMLPFFFVRLFEPGRYRNPLAVALRALFGLPRSVVTFAALLRGSIRHGSLVL